MRWILPYCLCIFLLLGPGKAGLAQLPFSRTIPVEEENSSLKSNVLFKDHNGFLWLGSSEGLYKIYGNKPVKFNTAGNEKLYVTAIAEDSSGTIWIGCKSGAIATIRDRQLVMFLPNEGVPKVAITAILVDGKNRIWFATGGEGIYYYDGIHLNFIDTKKGLSDDYVNCLFSKDGKTILAGTDAGISFINVNGKQAAVTVINSKQGIPDNIVRCIAKTVDSNTVVVGTQSKGFFHLDLISIQLQLNSGTKWDFGQINDLKDLGNEILIATQDMGLLSYHKSTHNYTAENYEASAQFKRISSIVIDEEANIWLAAESNLITYTGQYLHFWYNDGDLKFTRVHALFAEQAGIFWLSPGTGLYHCAINKSEKDISLVIKDRETFKGRTDITSLYKDKFGMMWVGTMGGGLYRMDTRSGLTKKLALSPESNFANILSIAGKNNEVWISTLNGVSRFYLSASNAQLSENILYDNYTQKDGVGSDYVYNILIDGQNRVWFATDGAGLTVYENGSFKNFLALKEFSSKVVYTVIEDNRKNIWVSTYNDGIFKYDGKKFTRYGLANGLTDLAVTSMAVDNANRIVLVNKKGIDVLDQTTNVCRHYGPESGIKEMQPNLNAISKDADGNLWIGTENGIIQLQLNPVASISAPVTVLENVLLFNQPLPDDLKDKFNYNQNYLSFVFAAVNYSAPEKIRFQYWLKGYSDGWETTNDRSVVFPRLSPGKYGMYIRASSNENFIGSPVTVYNFQILKPFWLTWWFALLVVLLAAGIIYWIIKNRVGSIRKKDQMEKERIQLQYDALKNQVNPHFLFNSFNALLNVVEETPKEAAQLIKHLSQFYRKMTAYRKKDVILLEEELDLLNSYMFIQNKRYGDALKINIDIPTNIRQSTYIPPLVLQLLAENAVKHNTISYDKPLVLSIFVKAEMLVISNNINPKFSKEDSEGLGLQNIESRYRLFAKKEVEYGESENKFIVQLPIIKSM